MPLVSVITPAYNCEMTIAETIESVINQTYNNVEMVIVDDCSTDNTVETIHRFTEKDDRVKLITQHRNQGAAAARNTAIENSNGRFIAFLDSDDVWKPHKLEKQISFMLENNYYFTFTSYEIMKSSSELTGRIFHAPHSIDYVGYLKNTIIGNLTVIMDKYHFGEIRVENGHLEDVLTWMHYLKGGAIAYGLDDNLASYRVSAKSKSGNKIKNAKRYFWCLRVKQELPIYKCLYFESCYLFNAIKKRVV